RSIGGSTGRQPRCLRRRRWRELPCRRRRDARPQSRQREPAPRARSTTLDAGPTEPAAAADGLVEQLDSRDCEALTDRGGLDRGGPPEPSRQLAATQVGEATGPTFTAGGAQAARQRPRVRGLGGAATADANLGRYRRGLEPGARRWLAR